MNATFTAARRVLLVFAATALGGCAMPTGGGPNQLGLAPAARANYTVCSGGHASRLPAREQVGRVCRPASSVRVIL